MRRGAVAAAAAMSLLATGCGGSTEGTPQPSSEAAVALWNPCTEVTEAQLRQLGVDPATRESGIFGVEEPGWNICGWHNDDINVGVYATVRTEAEIRAKPGNHGFRTVRIAGRDGLEYRLQSDDEDEVCDVVFSSEQGTLGVSVSSRKVGTTGFQPCERVRHAAEVLVPNFPA